MNSLEHRDMLLKKAMALCAAREMCVSDMNKKLISWGASENESEIITGQLVKEKYIDENRFSEAFTRDRFRGNKWGKIKIAHSLKLKGIRGDIIGRALEAIDDETYLMQLREIISHQRKVIKARNQYELKGKLMRFGLSKGYESHLLYDMLNKESL